MSYEHLRLMLAKDVDVVEEDAKEVSAWLEPWVVLLTAVGFLFGLWEVYKGRRSLS